MAFDAAELLDASAGKKRKKSIGSAVTGSLTGITAEK